MKPCRFMDLTLLCRLLISKEGGLWVGAARCQKWPTLTNCAACGHPRPETRKCAHTLAVDCGGQLQNHCERQDGPAAEDDPRDHGRRSSKARGCQVLQKRCVLEERIGRGRADRQKRMRQHLSEVRFTRFTRCHAPLALRGFQSLGPWLHFCRD